MWYITLIALWILGKSLHSWDVSCLSVMCDPLNVLIYCWIQFFPCGQMVKNPSAVQETWVWSLGWEDTLEKGKATHSSILAWRIQSIEEPIGLQSMGSQRTGHDWVPFIFILDSVCLYFVEKCCVLCSSVILTGNFVFFFCGIFVWLWYQFNGGLIEWVLDCSFLWNFWNSFRRIRVGSSLNVW